MNIYSILLISFFCSIALSCANRTHSKSSFDTQINNNHPIEDKQILKTVNTKINIVVPKENVINQCVFKLSADVPSGIFEECRIILQHYTEQNYIMASRYFYDVFKISECNIVIFECGFSQNRDEFYLIGEISNVKFIGDATEHNPPKFILERRFSVEADDFLDYSIPFNTNVKAKISLPELKISSLEGP